MFLNAASKTSLASGFSRLHDFLSLERSGDEISSVKRWLSMKRHPRWLIVFDNADDKLSVPILRYVPVVPWGHVLVLVAICRVSIIPATCGRVSIYIGQETCPKA